MCDVLYQQRAKRDSAKQNLIPHFLVVAVLLCLTAVTSSCGNGSQNVSSVSNSSPASSPSLSLSPDSATLASLQQLQFTARISGSPKTAVTWSASAGTISSSGVFTAPKVTSSTPVTITATSADVVVPAGGVKFFPSRETNEGGVGTHASATVTVIPPNSLTITTSILPAADASMPYATSLTATGGLAPYQWTIATGALPVGIRLLSSSGVITGVTALMGSYPLTTKVTDAVGRSATAALELTVSSNSAGGFDGPAELPRTYIQSAMSNSPAPGGTTIVSAGGDLQSALNNASCGDTIQLQAGATFTGAFNFPVKNCDDNHWIVVRTSADDSLLPPEGTRLTPCYAGVSSLPGRPTFNCASTSNVLAKLLMATGGNGPIVFASGANHYRLIGLEVTRLAGTGLVNALASFVASGTGSNIIFDRMWLHGTAQDETTRAIDLGASTYLSIVDSSFTDFHCIALTGACGDAQAIIGGLANSQMGPYKIVDNFLEASGENIMFGGGAATAAPADIQISHNHMFKPLTWMKGQAGYVGGKDGNPFVVKNLFELKNAQRVLLDGNILENSWGGFSQTGFAILLTPKNPGGCSICQVTDVTIRYNSISHVAAGLQIANALSDVRPPFDGQRYSIHDIVIDDIDGVKYDGPSLFAQISVSAGAPLLQNVAINHVTAFPTHMLFMIGDMIATTTPMTNFIFTNSIVNAGSAPVWSTGGGVGNCAFYDKPVITFHACFTGSTLTGNAIIGSSTAYAPENWPNGNYFPESAANIEFVNYNGGIGGDYHLQSSSPYKAKGTDGKDLGADMDALSLAIAGAE